MPAPLDTALRERLQATIRALAAQSANGKVRTRDVLDAFADEPAVSKAHVEAEMYGLGVEAQRGPRPGEGAGGRPRGAVSSVHRDRVRELRAQKKTPTEIARELGIARQHVYKLLSDED